MEERCARRRTGLALPNEEINGSHTRVGEDADKGTANSHRTSDSGGVCLGDDANGRGMIHEVGSRVECQEDEGSVREKLGQDLESSASVWAANFEPRPSKESVRNCSHVDHSIKEHIIQTLTGVLLGTDNWIEVSSGPKGA